MAVKAVFSGVVEYLTGWLGTKCESMVAGPLFSAVIENLTSFLIEEEKFKREVEGEVEWIKAEAAELEGLICFVRDAYEKQELDGNVKNWIADLQDMVYELEAIVDLIACRQVGNKREHIGTRLRAISGRQLTYDIKSLLAIKNLGDTGETSSNAIDGMVVPIVGMGGLDETTLSKTIFRVTIHKKIH